ncbi:MAG: M48 family metallopeptidase [Bacteroidota bacterium]
METLYKGTYYDGRSSRSQVIDCSVNAEAVTLHVENGTQQVWPLNEVKCRELKHNYISLQFGTQYPYMQLDVTYHAFVSAYTQAARIKKPRSGGFSSMPVLLAILGSIVLGLWLCYIWLLPFITDTVARYVPVSYEITLGKQALDGMIDKSKIDRRRSKLMNDYFDELHIKTPYEVNITVVDEPVVNAFALPGGQLVVYTGILKKMTTHEQLAALLAHEFSHVQLRHATRNIFRTLSGQILLSLIIGDMGGVSGTIMQHAEQLTTLGYSRRLEEEADENGLGILQQNQIDAKGMLLLFKLLDKEENIRVSEWISTHPDLQKRIEHAQQYTATHPYKPLKHVKMQSIFAQLKKKKS